MTKKQNKITVRILSILAVILMSTSIFMISVYKRALDEEFYKEALLQSQIYTIVADIIERKVTESFVQWEKNIVNELLPENETNDYPLANTALLFVLDTVIEKQTPELVSNIFGKIGLAEVFQNVTEKTVEKDMQWLKGEKEAHDIFGYIPTPQQIENIKDSNFTDVFNSTLKNAFGIDQLSDCTSERDVGENIARIASGNIKEVTCTSDKIDILLAEALSQSNAKRVVDHIGSSTDALAKNSGMNAFLNDIYNVSYTIAQIKQIALDTRSDVRSILKWSYVLLLLSITLGGVAVYLQKRGGRIMRVITIIFFSGVAITVLALMHYMLFSKLLIRVIPFENIALGMNVLTSAEVALLTSSITFIVEYIVTGLVSLSFAVGVWMSIIGGVAYGSVKIYENRNIIKKKFGDIKFKK